MHLESTDLSNLAAVKFNLEASNSRITTLVEKPTGFYTSLTLLYQLANASLMEIYISAEMVDCKFNINSFIEYFVINALL